MIELTPETEALARRLAEVERRTVDETIRQALEARASVAQKRKPTQQTSAEIFAARRKAIDDIVAKVAAYPVLDARSPQEIMDDLDPL